MNGLPAKVLLEDRHYLGRSHRATLTYEDEFGVMVFAPPSARRLPPHWLELVRWCLTGGPNAGSQQWKSARRWLRTRSEASTVVSYSDPSVGHTGALYRASGWLWAPTWHRLFTPPTGNGAWTARKVESVKDRWVSLLRPDETRASALAVGDTRIKRLPWAEYREPKWKRGAPNLDTGGGDYTRFCIYRALGEPASDPCGTESMGEPLECPRAPEDSSSSLPASSAAPHPARTEEP